MVINTLAIWQVVKLRPRLSDLSKTTEQCPSPDSQASALCTQHVSPIKHTQAPFPAHLVTDGSSDEATGAAASLRRETGQPCVLGII